MAGRAHRHLTGRGHVKKLDTGSVRNEINVTPLVDVCLVLLIIFMVILPMMTRGKEVPLPRTRHHSEEKDRRQPIISLVEDLGTGRLQYYLDQSEIKVGAPTDPRRFAKLKAKLQEAQEVANAEAEKRIAKNANPQNPIEPPGNRVYLKAGDKLPYEKVFPVIVALRDINAKIDIGTNEIREQ